MKQTPYKQAIHIVLFALIIMAFSSCTTTLMTISPRAYNAAVDNISADLSAIGNKFELTGSGSDVHSELIATEQTYSESRGYDTRLENEKSTYDNYTYTDSIGNRVEFEVKYKVAADTKSNDYLYNMGVVRCNCEDKKLYATICGKNGIVRQVTQIEPDQKSKVFDATTTYFTISGVSIGLSLLTALAILLSIN